MNKFYFLRWFMVLVGFVATTVFGQTETLTITRASFSDSAGNYGTNDSWSTTTTNQKQVNGMCDIFAGTSTGMQVGTSSTNFFYNLVEVPGAITKITIIKASGTDRAWTPYLSSNTVLSLSSINSGTALASKTVNTNGASWDINADENYKYFYLHSGGNTVISSIIIEYETTPTISIETPIAKEATNIKYNQFTANWENVENAEKYAIDVYTKEESPAIPLRVVGWDFEDRNQTADSGLNQNLNKIISTNATVSTYLTPPNYINSISSNNWTNGANTKYWQVSFSTENTHNLKLSSAQRSSNTGPRNFKVQYSLNGSQWSDVSGATVTVANNFTNGVLTDISLPTICENQPLIYLRWIMTSNNAVSGNLANGGTSAIGDIKIDGTQGGVIATPILNSPFTTQAPNTSIIISDLDTDTEYFYVVRAIAGSDTTENSNEISVKTSKVAIYENGAWSGVPSIDTDVIIKDELELTENLEAKSLTVSDAGGQLTVPNGITLKVDGAINNEAGLTGLVIKNGANLIQVQEVENSGAITVEKTSTPMVRNDMTLWSSPVLEQSIRSFAEGTLFNRIWGYDETNSTYAQLFTDNSQDTNFTNGNGYAIRVRNTLATGQSEAKEGQFFGVPFNGTTTFAATKNGEGYNLVGNPYASNINIDGANGFLAANNQVEAIYFWTHQFPTGSADFDNNYAVFSSVGGTLGDLENISVGQGFFVQVNTAGNITFNNAMRTDNSATFYKQERNRVWISLSDETQKLNQILVAYVQGATEGVDHQIDAKSFGNASFYTLIDNNAFAIQGRALPFNNQDIVKLGYNTAKEGQFTINIENKEGLFAQEQDIFLKDNVLNIVHNLSQGAYSFSSQAGKFDERFQIIYQNRELGVTDLTNSKDLLVYTNNETIVVDAKNATIASIEVYDAQGRKVFSKSNINASVYNINTAAKGVLIIKTTTKEGVIKTQKVVKK